MIFPLIVRQTVQADIYQGQKSIKLFGAQKKFANLLQNYNENRKNFNRRLRSRSERRAPAIQ
jgi:hypothetical protein